MYRNIFLSLLSAFCLWGGPLLAAEFHVSPKGDDAAPGSADKPFRTIRKALSLAGAGDVVTIHAGEYRQDRALQPRGGKAGAPLVMSDEAARRGSSVTRKPRRRFVTA